MTKIAGTCTSYAILCHQWLHRQHQVRIILFAHRHDMFIDIVIVAGKGSC